jgi:hypothetical protein
MRKAGGLAGGGEGEREGEREGTLFQQNRALSSNKIKTYSVFQQN